MHGLHAWLTSANGRMIRYLLVLLLVLTSLVGFGLRWFDFCEVVTSDEKGVTETCGGPDLSSAAVLAAVLLVLLLLWPDLSEFSAFGVTLKKMVARVEETVTETSRAVGRVEVKTSSIDRTSAAASDTATDLRRDLQEIRSRIETINERAWSTFDGGSSQATSTVVVARWDYHDQQNLLALCTAILGPEVLEEKRSELLARVSQVKYAPIEDLLGGQAWNVRKAILVGILVDRLTSSVSNGPSYGIRGDDARLEQRDRLLRLTRQLIGATMEGSAAQPDSLATAAATLAEIDPS